MKVKLAIVNKLTKILTILIFIITTTQACKVKDVFSKSMLSQTSNSSHVFVGNSTWGNNGSAKVYFTPGYIHCDDYCWLVEQNLSRIVKCNISKDSSNNFTYNVYWENLPSSAIDPQLNIQCKIVDPVNYYKQQTYTFVFNNTNSLQSCNTSFTSAPANMLDNLTITRNSTYVNTVAVYTFNLITPNFQMYQRQLYLSINYLTPLFANISVTYTTTTNETKTENITFLNNQSVFLVTNDANIRPYIRNITFDIVYLHPYNFNQQNMSVNLLYQYNGTNNTIYTGQKQYKNTYPPANSSFSTFNLQSIYNNSSVPINKRPNKPFSFEFNITVNTTTCYQYYNTDCYNLFDTMVVQLNCNDNITFPSSGSVTILSNQSQKLNFNFKTLNNSTINIVISNVTLTQGVNRVFINVVQNFSQTSQAAIAVKCYKNNQKLRSLQFQLNITYFVTNVRQSILIINELNSSYPSRLNQAQQFDLNITLDTPLNAGDYILIKIPPQYTFMQTNPINQTDNLSLCSANTNYNCFNGQNIYQIWVTGQFNNISQLIVSINNNTYRSPKIWGPFNVFQVNTYFQGGYNKDIYNKSITKSSTFYLHCKDQKKKCRDCDITGNCLSCYETNQTLLSFPQLNNGQCVSNCQTDCLTCSIYPSNCTTCKNNYSLYSQNKTNFKCVSSCPQSFISINTVCKPCDFGCLKCIQKQSNCVSCDVNRVLFNNTCVQSCPISYLNLSNTCQGCSQNCAICIKSIDNCTACNANYSLSLIDKKCLDQCPSTYFSQLSQGYLICATCGQGCKTCVNSTYCQDCSAGYFPQVYTANNSNICVKNCSAGRVFANNNCNTMTNQTFPSNSSNTTNQNQTNQSKSNSESTGVSSQSSSFKDLTALPCTILILLFVIVAGGSKLTVSLTNIFHLFTSTSGVLQIVSWCLALTIFQANSQQNQTDFFQKPKIIIFSALSLNFIINLVGFYFFKTDLFGDHIFYRHYFCLKNLMSARFYVFTTLMFIFMLTSNKAIEILFSNLFGIKCFSFKLENYSQILRHNYLRYASLIASLTALVASIMVILSLKNISLSNKSMLTLIDLCIVTILGMAATIKIISRNQSDYQKQQRTDAIDVNEQISNQPISDIPNIQQVKKQKHQTPTKSKSPLKAIILHCSRKKAELAQSRHQTQQYMKPFAEQEIICTDDHFQDKDIDQHTNQLNQTRVTTKVYTSKPIKTLNEGNQPGSEYRQNKLETKLTKIRSNRRQKQKVIKQFIGDEDENLKHQITSAFLPDEIKIMKQILNINDLYQKIIAPQQKEPERESQANLNNLNAPTTADKLHLLAKFKPADHEQLDRQTQLAIQQLDLAVDLMAYKNISLQKMFKYFELLQKEESESQKENYCSNLSTPYINNYFNNEVVLSKGSRNSRQTRKRTKKRRSQFRDGPKIFMENQNADLSPYVADFYAQQEIQNDNCQLQKEQIDEQGNIDAIHCRQLIQEPAYLMKVKPFTSLDNTAGSQTYGDFKKTNHQHIDNVSKSQQIEMNRHQTINKIGSSVPLKKKIQTNCGIPQTCQLEQDNVDYLQTDRDAGTEMKPEELEEENEYFQKNIANRMQAEVYDSTPGKPKVAIIKSRILCGSQEITSQFQEVQQVSKIMSRYGARQLLTIKKKRLASLSKEGVSGELNE